MQWVELEHDKTKRRHKFPKTTGAVASAKRRGWSEPKNTADKAAGKETPAPTTAAK
ncbi:MULTISPECIES: hypothetical protein [Prauserella salsuginis group]|uniref:Uncharacterized protein n=2 Tax=Prauserella salsuginis group TaxID=2893672 RepID=A0A839XZ42_9PSEU|nr:MULTISPECIES: hypothetical protein [Prauserella salsuginis group]MBB3666398.1 hypothetical protein [Prauserella sediminis]MCR3719136.1 hypothetical protein [Prauserella flava]MCR3735851.1 hypothetical protein [Prauserella salsuginis]